METEDVFRTEIEFLKTIAKEESCVIAGRSGFYAFLTILRLDVPQTAEQVNSCTITFSTNSPTKEDSIYKFTNSSFTNSQNVLYCSDTDFRTLVMLSEKLLRHAALMTLMLPDEAENPLPAQVASPRIAEQQDDLLSRLPENFTSKDLKSISEETGIAERTLRTRIQELLQNKQLVRLKKGTYRKL